MTRDDLMTRVDVEARRAIDKLVSMVEHVDYPHEAGTLYDCTACESTCHCEIGPDGLGGGECVSCAVKAEQERRWYDSPDGSLHMFNNEPND